MASENDNSATYKKKRWKGTIDKKYWLIFLATIFSLFILIGLNEIFDLPHLLRGENARPTDWIKFTTEMSAIVLVGLSSGFLQRMAGLKRKRAKETLKRERDFSQSILETANCMIFCLDGDAKITVFNQECERVTGYRREEVLGKAWPELFLPLEQRHPQLKSFAQWVLAHPCDRYEGPIITKSGEIRTILWSNTAILGSDEMEVVAIAIGYDITERKRAEEKLIESEQLFSKAFRTSPNLMGITTLKEGRIIDVNETYCRVTGYKRDELVGHTTGDFNVWADQEQRNLVIQKLQDEGRVRDLEVGLRTKCGDIRILLFAADAITLNNETCLVNVAIDITERKRVEEALKQSEREYRGLFESAHDAIIIFTPEGEIILDANQRACDIYGFGRSEFVGMSLEKISKDIPRGKREIQATLNKGFYHNFETVQYRKDGTEMLLDINSSVVDYQGKRAILSINRDITERKRAEEALRESEEKYRALIEAAGRAGEGIIIIQDNGEGESVFVFVNDQFCRMSGYSREELVGRSPWDLIPHDISVRLKDWYKRRHMGESLPTHYEAAGVRKDGTTVPLELSIVTMPWQGKIATVLYLRNITERKRAAEQIAYQAQLLAIVNDAVVASDAQYRLTAWNAAAESMYGWKAEEVLGRFGLDITRTEFPDVDKAEMLRAIAERSNWRGEATQARKDGTRFPVEVSSVVLSDATGKVTGFVSVNRDITEHKQAEEKINNLKQQMEFILGVTKTGLDIIDSQFNIRYIDPEWQKVYGDPTDKKCFDYFMGRNDICPDCGIVKALKAKNIILTEEILVKENNRPIQVITKPFQNEQGEWLVAEVNVDITERKKAEEEAIQHTKNMEFLSKAAMGFMELPADKDIYRFIGEQLRELIGDAIYVLINSFDQKTSKIQARAFLADDQDLQVVSKTLGIDPMGMSFVVSDEAWNGLIGGKLVRVPGGIYELSFGKIPKTACDTLEKLAGTGDIFVMGFTKKGELYGSATIIMREGCELRNTDVVETFIRQAGVALQRKWAEESLRENEERFRQLAENIDQVFWLTDWENDKLLYVNPSYEKLFGRSCQSVHEDRLSWYEVIHPDDRARVRESLVQNAKLGQNTEIEYRIVRNDGALRWILDRNYPIRDQHGKVYRIVSIAEDITERKRAEEMLRKSEKRLKDAQKLGHIGDWEYDALTQKITWSDEIFELYERDPALGPPTPEEEASYYSPEQGKILTYFAAQAVETGQEFSYDLTVKLPSGKISDFSAFMQPIKDSHGRVVKLFGTVQDITARKRAEEALKKSVQLLRDTGEMAQVGVWELDLSTQEVSWTEEVGRIHGVEPGYKPKLEEALNFYAPESRPALEAVLKKTAETGEPYDLESLFIPSGSKDKIWVRSLGSAVYSGGKIVKLTGTFQNIDKYKRAEEALRESEAKNRAILKVMPDSLFRITKDGIFLEVMPAKELSTYINPDEFTGRSISEFSPDVAQQFMQEVKKALETKDTRMFEYQQSLQGEMRYHEARIVPSGKDEVLSIVRDITERKRTEEVLKMERNRLEEVTKNIGAGLAIISKDFRTLWANQVLKEIFGEVEGKICFSNYNQRNQICPACGVQEIFEAGKNKVVHEQVGKDKDGNAIWSQIVATPIRDQNGNVTAALELVVPITERKQAEEELQRTHFAIDSASEGMAWLDKNFRYIYVNEGMCRMLGYTRDELLSLKPSELDLMFPQVPPSELWVEMRGIKAQGREGLFRRKDNITFPVELTIDHVVFKDEEYIFTIMRDITERKRLEEILVKERQDLKLIIDSSPIITFYKDKEGKFVRINKTLSEALRIPEEKFLGKTVFDLYSSKIAQDMTNDDQEVFKSGRPKLNIIEQHESASGIRWVQTDKFPIFDESGILVGLVGFAQDITEKKKMEAQLIQSERLAAVGTLAYGIAHEFNNILAGILGNAEFGMGNEDSQEVKECFQIIVENCERAKSITNHLLAFSRQRETKKQRADVTGAVESVLGLVERELEKRNIKVERKFNPIPDIVCDLGELSEVALNMITNARDAIQPRGGKLTIEINKKKDNIEMIFTDTGVGIPESIKSRIFEPFVTTKGALGQSETPGTGLGLFLSYGIISRYQGAIEVKSEVGQGSQFTVKIPISKNQTLPVFVKEDEPLEVPQNLNILLVDDEKPILSSIKKFLESKGHSVVACPSGKKGLRLFKNRIFDVVLSDITLPDMDGIKLISKLKSIDPKVRLIVLTGHLAEEKLNSARKAGADHVLTKPFKNENLYKAIGRVVNG